MAINGATASAEFYSELMTHTRENVATKDLVEQVMTRHPVLEVFSTNAKSATGEFVRNDIILAENTKTAVSDKSGSFSAAVDGDLSGTALFYWPNPIVTPTRLKWQDLQKNSGKEATHNLAKTHFKMANYDQQKSIANALHALASDDGGAAVTSTATTPGDKAFGLDHIVGGYKFTVNPSTGAYTYSAAAYEADPTGAGAGSEDPFAFGGITPNSTDHFWQGVRFESTSDTTNTTSHMPIQEAFRFLCDEIYARAQREPDIIIVGRDIWNEYRASFDAQRRYVDPSNTTAESEFRELSFDGTTVVRFDPDCPPKRAYFLRRDSLTFRYLGDNWLQVGEAQQVGDATTRTLDTVTPIVTNYLVGADERRVNGVLLRPSTEGGAA